jgi:hypothetical protein
MQEQGDKVQVMSQQDAQHYRAGLSDMTRFVLGAAAVVIGILAFGQSARKECAAGSARRAFVSTRGRCVRNDAAIAFSAAPAAAPTS